MEKKKSGIFTLFGVYFLLISFLPLSLNATQKSGKDDEDFDLGVGVYATNPEDATAKLIPVPDDEKLRQLKKTLQDEHQKQLTKMWQKESQQNQLNERLQQRLQVALQQLAAEQRARAVLEKGQQQSTTQLTEANQALLVERNAKKVALQQQDNLLKEIQSMQQRLTDTQTAKKQRDEPQQNKKEPQLLALKKQLTNEQAAHQTLQAEYKKIATQLVEVQQLLASEQEAQQKKMTTVTDDPGQKPSQQIVLLQKQLKLAQVAHQQVEKEREKDKEKEKKLQDEHQQQLTLMWQKENQQNQLNEHLQQRLQVVQQQLAAEQRARAVLEKGHQQSATQLSEVNRTLLTERNAKQIALQEQGNLLKEMQHMQKQLVDTQAAQKAAAAERQSDELRQSKKEPQLLALKKQLMDEQAAHQTLQAEYKKTATQLTEVQQALASERLAQQEEAKASAEQERISAQLISAQQQTQLATEQVAALQSELATIKQQQQEQEQSIRKQADQEHSQQIDLLQKQLTLAQVAQQQQAKAKAKAKLNLTDELVKKAYASGVLFARQLEMTMEQQRKLNIKLDPKVIMQGIEDGFNHRPQLSEPVIEESMVKFDEQVQTQMEKHTAKAVSEQKKQGDAFQKKFSSRPGVKKHSSGMLYLIEEKGTGRVVNDTDLVKVSLVGSFPDGQVFNSSKDAGMDLTFKLNDVLPALRDGVKLIRKGGKMRLVLPPELAYGDEGFPPAILPHSTLIYDIELNDVEAPRAAK